MSELSSITLFHFTDNLETLQNIILSVLRSNLVAEKISGRNLAYLSEMICFCDIPLSKVKEHVKWYGEYAIGIRPEFLKEKGASPVIYTHSRTPFLFKGRNDKVCSDFSRFPAVQFLKRSSGYQCIKHSDQFGSKRFIDEREWRIVTATYAKIIKFSNLNELKNKTDEEKHNVTLEPFIVTINPENIEYIIVSSRKEITQIVEWFKINYPSTYQEFLPKVLAYSQIERDF